MSRIRWYGPTLVLVFTVLLVMIIGPRLTRQMVYAQKEAHVQLVRNRLTSNPILEELNNAYRQVAKVVELSTVHIITRSHQRDMRLPGGANPELKERLRRYLEQFGGHRRFEFDTRRENDHSPNEQDFREFDVPEQGANGSGWVYDVEGHIITCAHVVENADEILVRFSDGSEREAQVLEADPKTDVAVLKVEGSDLHPAMLSREPVESGEMVFAFGSPFGNEFSMSQGIVSGTHREVGILGRYGYENFIQTDVAINPGNSGGPLTNVRGEVVGMNNAIPTKTGWYNGVAYAIPIDTVENVVEQLIHEGRVRRGYLGIYIADLDPKMASTFGFEGQGVLVQDAIKAGPAAEAGVQHGDIITKINDKSVSTAEMLRRRVARHRPGSTLNVELFRDGNIANIEIIIGELPDDPHMASRWPQQNNTVDPNGHDVEIMRKLGIERIETFTEELADRIERNLIPGVVVLEVRPRSIAAANGLRPGLVITKVQGIAVETSEQFNKELNLHDLSRGVRISTVTEENIAQFILLELDED